ncbi:MAG TPA: EndoU domain-containing protein [Stellaceae bacterium]|nr:EndoU domain-containing protein [Stellaceae bacterium]
MGQRLALRLALLALFLLCNAAAGFARDIEAPTLSDEWTKTDPPINLRHIELGEINHRGEAVGYHHRPNGLDPPGAQVLRIVQPPDANGIYRARVALRDPATGAWVQKKAPSTFFPDAMSTGDVVEAVLAAFHHAEAGNRGQFVGPSGRSFAIEGWHQSGRINAAYPLRGP